MITIEVSLHEASLIAKLREFEWGSMVIHKMKDQPIRIETMKSEMLDLMSGRRLDAQKNGHT